MRRRPLSRLQTLVFEVQWLPARRTTAVAVLAVALLGTLLAQALLPRSRLPSGASWVILAAGVTYLWLRLDQHKGWSKAFKHRVLDTLGGDVDDVQTWAVAALVGGAVLLMIGLLQRAA